ncbi:MAG: AmmeMemoRadiSam system protein B [Dehalococcoidia bacterium]|nr:AmmeMemoRadiSam system protein B [Dehalococcoidia bacterium]MDD5495272.1 AmmeMemoRadiSam system protein B [Dehalococcoidia bacterium]
MIRNAAVAGQFYPAWPDELREMIKYFSPEDVTKADAVGAVCPHAGYVYSGPVAGAVISRIKLTDTVIILGPNHRGMGKPFSIMKEGSWKTPLGEVKVDTGLAQAILKASGNIEEDSLAHRYEHSLEVQVPFLQYFKPDVQIVPIVLSLANPEVYREIGRAIAASQKATGIDAVILASSDMTHYEPHESAKAKDKQAIEAILNLDADQLVKRIAKYDISMCGYAPVVALITAAVELGAGKTELVKYQTSGDTSGDFSSVVGYAGIIIWK